MATIGQLSRNSSAPSLVPRTEFTLQPHHLQIVKILMILFIAHEPRRLPADFVLHVNHVVLELIAEVSDELLHAVTRLDGSQVRAPPTYQELKLKIEAATTEGSTKTVSIVNEMWELVSFTYYTCYSIA